MPEPANSHTHVAYSRAPVSDTVAIQQQPQVALVQPTQTADNGGWPRAVAVSRTLALLLALALALALLLLLLLPALVYYLARAGIDTDDYFYELPLPPGTRLSERITPELYVLDLKTYLPSPRVQFDESKRFIFEANITITLKCHKRMRHVQMHLLNLNISQQTFRLQNSETGESYSLLNMHLFPDKNLQQVVFEIDRHLSAGDTYELYLEYVGEISRSLNGLYRIEYKEDDGEKKWLATTQFQPTFARAMLPCYDEPEMKAKYDIRLTHPDDMIALSNSMEDASIFMGEGWKRTTYHRTPKMSSYLLAIVISQFEHADMYTKSGTMFRVWSRPSMKDSCDFAADIGVKILEFFEDYFGLHFPLEKQDMVAMPDFDAGAMENWGLIMYRDMFLLYSNISSATKTKARVAEIVAHELAHQWFGNLVTMEWWDELWLNEGFATYLQYLGTEAGLETDVMQTFPKTIHQAMNSDQMLTSHPLKVPVHGPEDIFQVFDRITYDKGATLVNMLNAIVGERVLHESIKVYLRNNAYGNANIDYLLGVMTNLMPKMNSTHALMEPGKLLDLKEIMKCWIRRAGFPVVTVKRDYNKNTFTIDQKKGRFVSGKSKRSDEPDKDAEHTPPECYNGWYVPVFYKTARTQGFVWLTPQVDSVDVQLTDTSDAWLLVNENVKGMFRTDYDEENWHRLINVLKANKETFGTEDRSQLLDDAFSLAHSGHLNYTIVMDLSTYLQYEDTLFPWEVVERMFTSWELLLRNRFPVNFRAYFKWLMTKLFNNLQRAKYDHLSDDIHHQQLRAMTWRKACQMGVDACTRQAASHFQQMKAACADEVTSSTCNPVDKNIRDAVYCTGVWLGDDDDWQFLWDKYQAEDKNPGEKYTLLYGVSCTQDEQKIERLLGELLTFNKVRLSEAGLLVELLAQNKKIDRRHWEFIKEHWDALIEKVGESSSMQLMLTASTNGFCTADDVQAIEHFLSSKELGVAKQVGKMVLENAKISNEWESQYGPVVDVWAKQFNRQHGIS